MKSRPDKGYQCKNCGKFTYPRRSACLHCQGREFEEVNFPQECTLITWSQIFELPWGINERFLTIGICQFNNGLKAMGRLSTAEVKAGMRMKAEWTLFRQIAGEDVWGWLFVPMEQS